MDKSRRVAGRDVGREQSRMPAGSVFYEKVVPALLITMGVITIVLIAIAAGVLLGIVPYR